MKNKILKLRKFELKRYKSQKTKEMSMKIISEIS